MFYLALFYNIGNLCVNWYVPATNWSGFENPLVGARWIALSLALVVFIGMGILPAIFGKERFYNVAQKENKDIGFMKAIGQAASSKPMMGLVGIVFALNFCGTIAGSIAMYIVIYYVKSGDVAGGLVLNAMNGGFCHCWVCGDFCTTLVGAEIRQASSDVFCAGVDRAGRHIQMVYFHARVSASAIVRCRFEWAGLGVTRGDCAFDDCRSM